MSILSFVSFGLHGIVGAIVAFLVCVLLLALALYIIREAAAALGWPIPPPIFKLLSLLAVVIAVGYALAIFTGYTP